MDWIFELWSRPCQPKRNHPDRNVVAHCRQRKRFESSASAEIPYGGQDGMSAAQPRRSSFDIARHTGKLVDVTRSIGGVLRATAMPEIAVPFPLRCATAGTVHPAYTKALHRRRSAGQASAL